MCVHVGVVGNGAKLWKAAGASDGIMEANRCCGRAFGVDLTEWNRKAEKEARSGKLSAAGANVPRGTIAASGD